MTVQLTPLFQFTNLNQISGSYLQSVLTAITQTINNANAGLTTWDHVSLTTRVFTGTGSITAANETILVVKKGTGAATAVTLASSPVTGSVYTVKDGKGDANTNNITVSPASGTIDGASNKVISTAYGVLRLVYNGTEWSTL